jgi:hypothetical protein
MQRKRWHWLGVLALTGAPWCGAQGLEGLVAPPEPVDVVLAGELGAPLPSPDGRFLAFSRPDYRGLWLLELATGGVRALTDEHGAGFHPAWAPSGKSIAFRTSTGGPRAKLRIVVAHPDGTKESASPLVRDLSLPFWMGERLGYLRLEDGRPRLVSLGPGPLAAHPPIPATTPGGALWRVGSGAVAEQSPRVGGKVFFLPERSPDGATFVVECLDGHLYLGASGGGELTDLGPGSYPSFVKGGAALLFERTADDGERLTSADIYLMDLATRSVTALTATPDRLERRPAMVADGRSVYFEEGGRLWKGVLR